MTSNQEPANIKQQDTEIAMWADHHQTFVERIDGPHAVFSEVPAFNQLEEVLEAASYLVVSACKFVEDDGVERCPASEADFYSLYVANDKGIGPVIGDAPTLFAACCMAKAYGDKANLDVRVEIIPETNIKGGEVLPHEIEIK